MPPDEEQVRRELVGQWVHKAEQGMPVHSLPNLRKLLADLAESIQKVREMEASGIYQETPDVFGRYI